jgi:Cu(I)/Ag(I) efflux system membrane fusion protein
MREIELGPMLGDSYVVMDGLMEGEEVVSRGAFSIDAAAQLEGKTSMMSLSGPEDPQVTDGYVKTEFRVSGLCEMCTDRIETAARSVKGVSNAIWNIKSNMITVEFRDSETTPDSIHKAIAQAGHDTDKFKADDKVYGALPECCLYRK